MAQTDKNTLIVVIAVFLIFIAIILYWIWKQKQLYGDDWSLLNGDGDIDPTDPPDGDDDLDPGLDDPPDGEGDGDPYTPPGYQILRFDKVTSNSKSITFNFDKTYRANLLSGNVRPGGGVYTNIRIKYKTRPDGSWKHINTVGAWPDGFANFSTTINDNCAGLKFEAEQGLLPWIGDRYVDEVHGELLIEVGV